MLSRRDLLRALLASGVVAGPSTGLAQSAPARNLIVVFASGGWDTTFVFDPKLEVPTIDGPEVDESAFDPSDRESTQTFSGLRIGVNEVKRPAVSAFFSAWADRCALINGLNVGTVSHVAGSVRVLTGTTAATNPDLATIAGYSNGQDKPIPHMNLGTTGFTGELAAFTGRTGASSQLKVLIDRAVPLGSSPTFVPDEQASAAIDLWLDARAPTPSGAPRSQALISGYQEALARSRLLADEIGLADDLILGKGMTLSADAGGPVSLLSSGLSRTLILGDGTNWDTHRNNVDQHAAFDGLFAGLDGLMQQLEAQGILADTTVAVLSEMGRTPVLNGEAGKDHWPTTSALILGAGVAGGITLGATDDNLDPVGVHLDTGDLDPGGTLIGYDHLAAALLELVGVDPEPWLPGTPPLRAIVA